MFLFTNKKVTGVWNSEMGSRKSMEKTEDTNFTREINLYFHCSENITFYILTAVKYSFLKICIILNQYFSVFHYFVCNKSILLAFSAFRVCMLLYIPRFSFLWLSRLCIKCMHPIYSLTVCVICWYNLFKMSSDPCSNWQNIKMPGVIRIAMLTLWCSRKTFLKKSFKKKQTA